MDQLGDLDIQQLLRLRAAVDRELVLRGSSGSVGEIGEKIAIAHFAGRSDLPGLALAPRGTKNIDAISRTGERYSVKTLQRAKKTGTIYPSPEGDLHPLFEFLLIVVLSDHYELEKIYRLSWTQFVTLRSWDKRMNAWYLIRSKRVLQEAEDLT